MRKRNIVLAAALVFFVMLGGFVYKCISIKENLFKMNAELKSEGYYMGGFEFKMVGIVYYLDKGQFLTALSKINQLDKQMKTRQGLVKIPKFNNAQEKLNFYLSLQNPKTGAFMDDSYPTFTYIAPTLNMIENLEGISKEANQPLHLKYPLKFLDEINTPQKLKPFLDDFEYIHYPWSKLKAPYIAAVSELAYFSEFENSGTYTFSSEWKDALLNWLYNNQDSKTGYWGVKVKKGSQVIQSADFGSTYHIFQLFVDEKGSNRYAKYPLRYANELFTSLLDGLSEPMPTDADLDEQHDWSLNRGQGIDMLARLWNHSSDENKNKAKVIMEQLVKNRFEKFYREPGGFSLYTSSKSPDLDGTGTALYLFDKMGITPGDRQSLLWGKDLESIRDYGEHSINNINDIHYWAEGWSGVNSIRFYENSVNLNKFSDQGLIYIYYPRKTSVLDIYDLRSKVGSFVENTNQDLGNWTSKDSIKAELNLSSQVSQIETSTGKLEFDKIRESKGKKIVVIAIDELQIPRYKATFTIRR